MYLRRFLDEVQLDPDLELMDDVSLLSLMEDTPESVWLPPEEEIGSPLDTLVLGGKEYQFYKLPHKVWNDHVAGVKKMQIVKI